MDIMQLTILLIGGVCALYVLNCLYAGHVKRVSLKLVVYHVVLMAALGMVGELTVDGLYNLVFGSPLWIYRVLPVHHGYTSIYSLFIWGAMGFQIYLLHDTLSYKKLLSLAKLTMIFTVEAIILEALLDLTSLALFGKYIYYYQPGGLWHITAFQVIPLYFLTGYVYIYILVKFRPRISKTSQPTYATR
jgi:hypothetical protein